MPEQTYRSIIERIARIHSSPVTVFGDFCRISACALAAGGREEEYKEAIKRYSKEELGLLSKAFALMVQEAESNPFNDILGHYYLDIAAHSSKQARGEFYTPQCISEMMARMVFDPEEAIAKGKPITINEPACGAGGMILAIAKLFSPLTQEGEKSYVDLLRVTAQDLNPVASDMTFINTSLWGIPAKIIRGNFLDSQGLQQSWNNIHWTRVGEDERLKTMATLALFRTMVDVEPNPPEERHAIAAPDREAHQVEFDLNLGMERGRGR